MRYYTGRKNSITIGACLIFCIFVFTNEMQARNKAEALIRQHALVIADGLWNVNIEGTAEYLRLATVANNYSSLTISDTVNEVFQTFNQESLSPLEKFFRGVHLTPQILLTSPVQHHGKTIGTIKMVWNPPTIYTDIYVLLVLAMITATLHMYLRSLMDNANLEERIRARTAELVQSNRTLLREFHQKRKTASILRKSEEEYRLLYRDAKIAEEVYRSLIHSSADAILICNTNKEVEYLSATFTDLFGWQPEDVKGTHIDLFTPENRESASEIFTDILDNGASYQAHEIQAVTKDGHPVEISLSGSRFNDHKGHPTGILFVIRDISHRKKMEKQLQRAERMEAVGTLAGGIAHDFNNLLMGIQGNISLALLEAEPKSSISDKLSTIESYIQRGQELTGQLLGFARGGKYEIRSTDLNQLLQEERTLFGRTRKDILFREEYQTGIWPVEVDSGQIRQVLLNLYVNAGQAMPEGGTIIVSTRNVDLDVIHCSSYKIPPGRYVQIFVTDSGHGMDKQTMARIFDPFFTTKEIGRGTGLGLASAYGIIKNHHGFIDVYSELGQGTTFIIYLPASDKAVQRKPEQPATVEQLQGHGTILLVDDEAMILEVGAEMLKAIGYTVVTVSSGKEACELYQREHNRFAAVILDMIMPGMDGGAVFERLKAINPDVNVLLSSGYSMNDKASGIMAQGCAGFLQKPFDIKSLSGKLQEILSRSAT